MTTRCSVLLACILLGIACGDKEPLYDTDADADADADGYTIDEDCDDTDPEVHPGAEEFCNQRDDDCDENIDEDATDADTWYADSDGDGYGDASNTALRCEQPDGHSSNDSDCDDTDADVNPDATETWYDGVDQDCDGWSDYDQDGDGHDSDMYDGDDCDDSDASISPDATDLPYDGVDQDCDGANDYDQDADGYLSDAYGGADCDDTDADVNPDATETWYDGVDQDCDGANDYDQDAEPFVTVGRTRRTTGSPFRTSAARTARFRRPRLFTGTRTWGFGSPPLPPGPGTPTSGKVYSTVSSSPWATTRLTQARSRPRFSSTVPRSTTARRSLTQVSMSSSAI